MNPDEEEPKHEGEATPEDARAEQAAAPDAPLEDTEPQLEELEASAEPEPEPVQAYEAPASEPLAEPEPEPIEAYEPPEPAYVEPEPPLPVYEALQPPAAGPPPRIHEAAAEILHE